MSRETWRLRSELQALQAAADRLDRAVQAALEVRMALNEVMISLGNAQEAGMRGMTTSSNSAKLQKHGALTQARLHQRVLRDLLQRYREELQELGRAGPVLSEITRYEMVQDLGDSLLVDLGVQSKIKESVARARELNQRITTLMQKLADERSRLRERSARLETEIQAGGG